MHQYEKNQIYYGMRTGIIVLFSQIHHKPKILMYTIITYKFYVLLIINTKIKSTVAQTNTNTMM